jgi:hypothetical protein
VKIEAVVLYPIIGIVHVIAHIWTWVERFILGKNKLRSLDLPPLGLTKDALERIAGRKPLEHTIENGIQHLVFQYGGYHVMQIWLDRDGKATRYVYRSARPSPKDDLLVVLERYGQGLGWHETEPGYLYRRDDGKIQVYCSAAPLIGVCLFDNSSPPK